ncbi:MAG: bifunctional metallophosphatase/5'-nucleotidase [Clostridiales bacterium]|nr:bifunctional metallophosphatase/5'-nucleotidase [Clostridiales bacterium]
MRKVLALLLSVVMTLTLLVSSAWADEPKPLDGKTVILHTNDVHGNIKEYAKVAAMKDDYKAQGAQVILADAGDYSQGTVYVSLEKGKNAVTMMNLAGYDVATIGNHEFDYGYDQLKTNLESAAFKVVCANVLKDGNPVFDAYTMIIQGGVKVAFVGVETPEAQTKANPALIQGLTFLAGDEMYAAVQDQVNAARTAGADIVIVLAHLGVDSSSEPNTSYDLYKKVSGIDFIIDGHSHTVMIKGPNGEKIQSTGTALANVGAVIIDNATKKIESNQLIPIWHTEEVDGDNVTVYDYTKSDETVANAAKAIIDPIDADYGQKFAESAVDLNGAKAPGNRTEETNLGDLITDAMMWAIKTKAPGVDMNNAVAITNGGGIRAAIAKGDITKKDVNTVLPFGNTLAVVYVKGSELLEALEVSTYCTPKSLGGFPQFAGMEVELNTACEYDANDTTYPGSTYFGPKSINRITIKTVNGKAFDKDATYAVITNDFLAAGGDTYYAFAAAQTQFDTGLPLDEILMEYITLELNGVVTDKYAAPQGRLTIVNNPPVPEKPESPATGDTGVVIYMGLAILALTGGAFVARKKELF